MNALFLVLTSARKDLIRRLRDPWALLMWIGIPIVIGGLIVMAMGGSGGGVPRVTVFVVDRDDSFVSRFLVDALGSERAKVIAAETLDETTARRRMDDGEASALLVIPEGFGEAVLQERALELELVTNPSQRIFPGIVINGLEILSEGTFYVHRLLGDEVRRIATEMTGAESGLSDLRLAEASVRLRHTIERVGPYVFPPVISVKTVIANEKDKPASRGSLAGLYLPSMLLMALLFISEGLADDIWRERELGLLRRVAIAPGGAGAMLLGKLGSAWLIMLAVVTIGLAIMVAAFDVPLRQFVPAALWASFSGAVLFALMLLLKLFASSQKAAGLIGNLLLFPLIMVGGSMIPFEAMPAWLANIGRYTPNGWSMTVLKSILSDDLSWSGWALSFGMLALAGAVLVALAASRFRSFARGAV